VSFDSDLAPCYPRPQFGEPYDISVSGAVETQGILATPDFGRDHESEGGCTQWTVKSPERSSGSVA
jgi:hypothetical protein